MKSFELLPSSKPSVEEQIKTLYAIQKYNKALPKKRQKKDSLPEITATNIAATYQVKRTIKKGAVIIEMETKYKAIGIVDGTSETEHDNPFSLAARQQELQRSASA